MDTSRDAHAAGERPADTTTDDDVDYFTADDRERIGRWRAVVARRPPMTREQIESVAAVLRQIDAQQRAA